MASTHTPTLLRIAPHEAPILQNLFELYAHDFSAYVPIALKESGRFEIAPSNLWWTCADHSPFFIREGDSLRGFALVRRGSRTREDADAMDMAEFFVIRGARGRGLGTEVAHQLFTRFPGRWEVRVRASNIPALRFWRNVVESWGGASAVGETWSTDGVAWEVLRLGPT